MDDIPLYIPIGSIAGIVSAVLVAIIDIPKVYKTIQSCLSWLWHFVMDIPNKVQRLIRYFKWLKLRPTYRIINISSVLVWTSLVNNRTCYHIDIDMDIEYINRSDIFSVQANHFIRYVTVSHGSDGIDRSYTLRLGSSSGNESLGISGKSIIKYKLVKDVNNKPVFRRSELCNPHIKINGTITNGETTLSGDYKMVGRGKRRVDIVWRENDKEEKETTKRISTD